MQVATLKEIKEIASGAFHACVLRSAISFLEQHPVLSLARSLARPRARALALSRPLSRALSPASARSRALSHVPSLLSQ